MTMVSVVVSNLVGHSIGEGFRHREYLQLCPSLNFLFLGRRRGERKDTLGSIHRTGLYATIDGNMIEQ